MTHSAWTAACVSSAGEVAVTHTTRHLIAVVTTRDGKQRTPVPGLYHPPKTPPEAPGSHLLWV